MNKHLAILLKLSEYRTLESIRDFLYRKGNFPLGYMLPNIDSGQSRKPIILVIDVADVTGISIADLYLGLRLSDGEAYTPFSGIQVMNFSRVKEPRTTGRSNVVHALRTLSSLLEEPIIVWDNGIGQGTPSVMVDSTVPNASELLNILKIINTLGHRTYSIRETEFSEGLATISPTSYIEETQVTALSDSLNFLVKTGTHSFIASTYIHKVLTYYIPHRFDWLDHLFLTGTIDDDLPHESFLDDTES